MNLRTSFQARIACVLTALLLVVVAAVYFAVKAATGNYAGDEGAGRVIRATATVTAVPR